MYNLFWYFGIYSIDQKESCKNSVWDSNIYMVVMVICYFFIFEAFILKFIVMFSEFGGCEFVIGQTGPF